MLEAVANGISGPDVSVVNWSHSRDEIVGGVEVLFSAVKEKEQDEQKLLEDIWDVVEKAAALAGEEAAAPIELGVAAAFAPFAAIGAGYAEAIDEIKRKEASTGFSDGLVLGAMRETPDNVRDYFWQQVPVSNSNFPESEKTAQYYRNGGLVLGYIQGTEVQKKNLATALWNDIRGSLPNGTAGPGDGDTQNWGRGDWIDFYSETAGAFYKEHITD